MRGEQTVQFKGRYYLIRPILLQKKIGVTTFLLHMKHASVDYDLHITNKNKCFCLCSRMKDFIYYKDILLSAYAILIPL